MINIASHRIVDMINSRDYDDVVNWLKTFPNISVVSRDGSVTYKNAIMAAHPDAIQVSDRFHLLKNLTKYCKDYLVKVLKPNVAIESIGQTDELPIGKEEPLAIKNKKLTLKEKCDSMDSMLANGYKKTKICRILNMDIRTFDKLQSMTENEKNSAFQTKMQLIHQERVEKKQKIVDEVRERFKLGFSKRAIARDMTLSFATIKNYLDPNFSGVNAHYGVKKASLLSPYLEEINTYIEKGYKSIKIEEIIRGKGYNGSSSTIRHYISSWKVSVNNACNIKYKKKHFEMIERRHLIKLLYKPIEKVKKLKAEQVERVFSEYPVYCDIIKLVNQFRGILSAKKISELDVWIEKANSLNIREITSFVNGINKDIIAVKNAVMYDYNNGLAEGSVNKLKVIKRIMYGRCNFDTLRKKVLRLELTRKIN